MRLALPLLTLIISSPVLALNFNLDIPVLHDLLPCQDSTSRTANTQTSFPTASGTAGGPDTATTRTANTQTSYPTASGTTPTLDNTTTRTANTQVSQPAGTNTVTSSTSSSSSTSPTSTGTTTSSRTTSAMVAVAAPLRTHDVHLPAACVGLAAVAIGMGML